jgi:hypothetical protein
MSASKRARTIEEEPLRYARSDVTPAERALSAQRLESGRPFGPWSHECAAKHLQYAPLPLRELRDGRTDVHLPRCWWATVITDGAARAERTLHVAAAEPQHRLRAGRHYGVFVAGGAIAHYCNGDGAAAEPGDVDVFVITAMDALDVDVAALIFRAVARGIRDALRERCDTGVLCQGNDGVARLCADGGTRRIDVVNMAVRGADARAFPSFLETFDLWPARVAVDVHAHTLHARYGAADRAEAVLHTHRVDKYRARGYEIAVRAHGEAPAAAEAARPDALGAISPAPRRPR